jgi:FtsZ-binding cell division protein ZapB
VLEAVDALIRAERGQALEAGDEQALDQVQRLHTEVEELKRRRRRPRRSAGRTDPSAA